MNSRKKGSWITREDILICLSNSQKAQHSLVELAFRSKIQAARPGILLSVCSCFTSVGKAAWSGSLRPAARIRHLSTVVVQRPKFFNLAPVRSCLLRSDEHSGRVVRNIRVDTSRSSCALPVMGIGVGRAAADDLALTVTIMIARRRRCRLRLRLPGELLVITAAAIPRSQRFVR